MIETFINLNSISHKFEFWKNQQKINNIYNNFKKWYINDLHIEWPYIRLEQSGFSDLWLRGVAHRSRLPRQ